MNPNVPTSGAEMEEPEALAFVGVGAGSGRVGFGFGTLGVPIYLLEYRKVIYL